MDIDRLYNLMGSALKRVYGYYIKRPLQRFNIDNRAEKIVETQRIIPMVAPRHSNTDHLFQQIIQNNPHFKKEINEKHEDLIKRMSSMEIISNERTLTEEEIKETEEMRERVRNRLPQSRQGVDIPLHAYTEPKYVPKGRISLIRALDFIGKHSKNAEEFDSETIAKQFRLDEEEVKHILDYFKPFYKENISDPIADTEEVLGEYFPKQQFKEIFAYLKPKSQMKETQIESTESIDQTKEKIKT